jgi:type I restriction enzyme S subunit
MVLWRQSSLAGDWPSSPLGSLVKPGRSISYGIVQPGLATFDGVPIVRVGDVRNGRIATSKPLRVHPMVEAQYGRTRLVGGELLLTLVGTVGESAVVPVQMSGWNVARAVAVIPIRDDVGAQWVRLSLTSPSARHALESHLNTTVQATLNLRDVAKLPISMPPPVIRAAITETIAAFDDGIELHRRMIETLALIGQTVFKAWFVDFDPVREKVEGRELRAPAVTAEMFPDRLEDSALGQIPEGWAAGSFGDLVVQRSVRLRGRHATVLSAVATGTLVKSDDLFNKRVYSKDISKYLLVEQGDFAYNPSRINIGSIGMLEEAIVGAVSPVYVVARPRVGYGSFVAFNLALSDTKAWINTLASGSVRQSLSYEAFASIPSVVPPERVTLQFETLWHHLRAAIDSHAKTSRTLAALRDALLPKLLSGAVHASDAVRVATEMSA